MSTATLPLAAQPIDAPRRTSLAVRLNWLRAGVLGANDGIVSVAAIVVGVAGATSQVAPIATAAVAGLVGGAISMGLGEYVSVSSQRDSQHAVIAEEKRLLRVAPLTQLDVLAKLYREKGLSSDTADRVARELSERDALGAHLEAEFNIDRRDVASAWHAAFASASAFTVGAILPVLAILLPPAELRVPVTFAVVLLALALTGAVGARIGAAPVARPTLRVLFGGALALAVSFALGSLLGTSGIL